MLTARQAMERAIKSAEMGEIDEGNLWLRIASELRIGEWLMSGVKGVPLEQPASKCCPYCVGRCNGRCTLCHDRLPLDEDEPKRVGCDYPTFPHAEGCPGPPACSLGREDSITIPPRRADPVAPPAGAAPGATNTCRACGGEIVLNVFAVWVHERGGGPECPTHRSEGGIVVPAPEPAYRRAETEVLQRIQDEPTPAYEAAGETLGETRAIPTNIAHPQPDSVGPRSTCLNPECGLVVLWIVGRGWVHDVEGHPAGCEHAAEVRERG